MTNNRDKPFKISKKTSKTLKNQETKAKNVEKTLKMTKNPDETV